MKLSGSKFDHLDEMKKFLKGHKLPKLNQESPRWAHRKPVLPSFHGCTQCPSTHEAVLSNGNPETGWETSIHQGRRQYPHGNE